jgi:hypothetical protein
LLVGSKGGIVVIYAEEGYFDLGYQRAQPTRSSSSRMQPGGRRIFVHGFFLSPRQKSVGA